MKRTRTSVILLLLLTLLLTGCSTEALLERGVGLLDEIFAGDNIQPIPSAADPEPDPDPEPNPEPDPAPAAQDEGEEPDIIEGAKPVVPDYSAGLPSTQTSQTQPDQPKTEPAQTKTEPTQSKTETAASTAGITPSHTDVTFFSAGESFRYLPEGVQGVYACEYTTGNEKVASVDANTGKVTAVGPGTTKIKMHVESNGQYDFECIVRCSWEEEGKTTGSSGSAGSKTEEPVLPPTPSAPTADPSPSVSAGTITASHSDATFFNPKEFFKFLPVGAGDDAVVSYTTSDSKVAEVNGKTGVVTAVGPGTATVTMTVDCGGTDYIFDCIVRCNW